MKFLILALVFLASRAYSQPYEPRTHFFEFHTNGIGFDDITILYKGEDPVDHILTPQIVSYILGAADKAFVVEKDTLRCSGTIDSYDYTISILIDRDAKRIRSLTIHHQSDEYQSTVSLHGLAYSEINDTLFFTLDSTTLAGSITYAVYDTIVTVPEGYTGLEPPQTKWELKPYAVFTGKIVGLQSHFSQITPKEYSAVFRPDTVKKQYDSTLTFTYYNNSPDTVRLVSLAFEDIHASSMNITYADGSSLTTPQTIMPFTSGQIFQIRIISKEGPQRSERTMQFIASKEIQGTVYLDTFRVDVEFLDIRTRTYLSDERLEFNGAKFDTIVRTDTVFYRSPVVELHLDTLPMALHFSLIKIDTLPGRLVLHFSYVGTKIGEEECYYKIFYSYKTFKETIERSPDYVDIYLTAVTSTSGVHVDAISQNIFHYDPSARQLKLTLPRSSPVEIALYDLRGKMLQHEFVSGGDSEILFVPTANISSGMYLITARAGEDVYRYKLSLVR